MAVETLTTDLKDNLTLKTISSVLNVIFLNQVKIMLGIGTDDIGIFDLWSSKECAKCAGLQGSWFFIKG